MKWGCDCEGRTTCFCAIQTKTFLKHGIFIHKGIKEISCHISFGPDFVVGLGCFSFLCAHEKKNIERSKLGKVQCS